MPNNDYILRGDAVSAFCRNCEGTEVCGQLGEPCEEVKQINAIPAADVEPKQRWIPVTEKLPEVGEDVLIYAVGKSDDFSSVMAITDRIIFRLFTSSEGVETWSSPWQYFMTNYEITHWMPLPEPPKEETVNEITPEMIESAERNEKRIKEMVDQFYDELIAEKRAEIERLKAEIAKMPPLDYEKLAANPPVPPKEDDNGDKL